MHTAVRTHLARPPRVLWLEVPDRSAEVQQVRPAAAVGNIGHLQAVGLHLPQLPKPTLQTLDAGIARARAPTQIYGFRVMVGL